MAVHEDPEPVTIMVWPCERELGPEAWTYSPIATQAEGEPHETASRLEP
jgi:hypothetical protein